MPRSIWNGAITFGLVTIPVGLYSAIDEKDFRFNQLHGEDSGRIRYKKVCSKCDKEISSDEIVKGYEIEKDKYVVFDEEELAAIPSESGKAIDIVAFVPLEQIDPVYFQRPYYLAPESTGIKAYKLLEKALSDSGRVGLAKISIRDKERLATLRVKDGLFILETMHWPDEIRQPEFEALEKNPEIRPAEVAMAQSLIENLSEDFHPEGFIDEYRQRLELAVEAKVAGEEITFTPTQAPTQILDLMEALKASVDATKGRAAAREESRTA
ncbi:MAG: Ku protein [Actinomycetota bacterium]